MGQRNVEWYSVHTNGVALREMAQRNVEWFREMARRNVAWYSVHTSLRKKGETYRIGSALRQGEVKTLQHSSYTMWWFRDSLRIRWRHAPQQIAVPFAVCTFSGFGEIAFTSRLKRALRFEKFHVMLTNWMFSQSVWCSAKTCVRSTIRHYADPFYATLHCLHVRCTILH